MKDGGPAYPCTREYADVFDNVINVPCPGMTMRQRYKIAALQGLLAGNDLPDGSNEFMIAGYCADMADAMLKEDQEHEREK